MKNQIKPLLVLLALLVPSFALAEMNVAVLNPQLAIIETDEAQNKLKELRDQPSFSQNVKELQNLQKEFKQIAEQFQKDEAVMGQEERQSKIKQIQEKQQDIEYLGRKLQIAEQEMLQKMAEEMQPKFRQAVTEIIKSEGIDLLLDRKSVLHADSAYSITSKVTDKMNQIK